MTLSSAPGESVTQDLASLPRQSAGAKHLVQERAIVQLCELISDGRPIQALMAACVDVVAAVLDVEQVMILEYRSRDGSLILRASKGRGRYFEVGSRVDPGTRSQADLTLMSNGVISLDELRSDSHFQRPTLLREHGIASGISTVIRGRSGPVAVMIAQDGRQYIVFPEEDRTFFQCIAGMLSVAVQMEELETRLGYQDRLLGKIANHDDAWPARHTDANGKTPDRAEQVTGGSTSDVVEVGCLKVEVRKRCASVDGNAVELPPMELALLLELALQPGRPIPAEELGRRAWPHAPYATSDDVRRHIYRLRRSLGDQHREQALIRNRRGFGYALDDSSTET
jgi:DNA-binding winged helix-turn-helix (wHTH) protein